MTNDFERKDWRDHDVGNKDRFVRLFGSKLYYIHEDRLWAVYDGSRWNTNPGKVRILKKAELAAKTIFDEAKRCEDEQGHVRLWKWARASENRPQLENMLKLASDELGVSVDEFDADPSKINCKNGLVDLKTGELVPHSAAHMVTKSTAVDYNPAARSPTWERFLNDIFQGDVELIEWIKVALGYSLTGNVDEQVFFTLFGMGANGKTVLTELMLRILGDYGSKVDFDQFLSKDRSSVRKLSATGKLKGLRFAIASEASGTIKWDEQQIKDLTGSGSLIGARLYGSEFTFKPTHKLWFECNRIPPFKDGSHGWRRRVRIVPLEAQFTGDRMDKHLLSKLWVEREGVFASLVEAAKTYYAQGLGEAPKAIEAATDKYLEENDSLSVFIRDCLERDVSTNVSTTAVFSAYERWCVEQNEQPQSSNYLPGNLQERGIQRKRTAQGMVYVGWKLRDRQKPANDNWQLYGEAMVDTTGKVPTLEEWLDEQPQRNWKADAVKVGIRF